MDAATAMQSRLIGAILVEKKLVTGEQLERALELQENTGERLGEIVVAEFGVSRLELASVLAEQWAELENAERTVVSEPARSMQGVEPLTPADVQLRRPIGEIFVELGFISHDQLDAALDVQRETGARIGEILVEQGSLTRLDLASALAEQWSALQKLRPPAPVADPQPWQNGVPVAQPAEQALSADDRAAFTALEERLRIVERAAAATPWQEDLRLVTSDLRAAVSAVEARLEEGSPGPAETALPSALEAVTLRIDALETAATPTELAALRSEVDALKERPVTVEGLADLREAVERLEQKSDPAAEITRLKADIEALGSRVDGLAANGELTDKLAAVAGQAELAQTGIAGLSHRIDALAGLEGRLDEVAARLPGEEVIEELRRALAELATQAGNDDRADQDADIASLVARLDQLAARVDDVAATRGPDLTSRIDDLAVRIDDVVAAPAAAEGLEARIDSLEALADRGPQLAPVDDLRARVEELAALVECKPDPAPLDEIRARVEQLATTVEQDDSIGTLDLRLGELEQRLAEVTPAADLRDEIRRVAESTATERESLAQALYARVEEITSHAPREDELTELRSRLDELAAGPTEDRALQLRVDELAVRLEGLGALEGTIAGLRESLDGFDAVRVGDALATGARLTGLEAAIDSLAGLEARIREGADLADRSRLLEQRLDGTEGRLVALDALEESVSALAAELELRPDGEAVAGLTAELRAELAEELSLRSAQLEAQWAETAALRAQVDDLQESVAGRASFEARLESMLEQRLAEVADRVTNEVAGARADAAEAVATVRGETGSLAARIDELLGLRHADVQSARAAGEELAARVDALAGLRADDAEAARAAAADLSERLESLAGSLSAEASAARAAAELAGAELAARLDDHAERSTAAAFGVEQALRDELGGVAARLEERDAQGIEAREELRGELERVASSVGWRLERIEESLASPDAAQLKAAVAELERRLEGQVAVGEEQVRVTERALRKGLASLGEKLVDSESAYVDAGNALRRSIERLGAAVVEADARMADQIPVSEAEGCVAFAPTAAGYRLVELPGKPPEVGATVELEGIDGALLVTRYGRSPLPLDSRSCAYLDRA